MSRVRCAGRRGDGRPCRGAAQRNDAFCWWHVPERVGLRPVVSLWGGPGDGLEVEQAELLDAVRRSAGLPPVLRVYTTRFKNLGQPIVLEDEFSEEDLEPGAYVLEHHNGPSGPVRYRWQGTEPSS